MLDCPFYRPKANWCIACMGGPCKVLGSEKLRNLSADEIKALVNLTDGFGQTLVVSRKGAYAD